MTWPVAILVGSVAMALVMSLVWFVQWRTGNAGIVDVTWTWGVGALGLCFATFVADGDTWRRAIIAVLTAVWSLRLGGHLLVRVMSHSEDGRYKQLKADWGEAAQSRMFWFFQSQAIGAVVFAVPMLVAGSASSPLNLWDCVGIAIGSAALVGEWIADHQLAQFKADSSNKGKVCEIGLWHYSRHPNYFFEWLYWWSYVALAATTPWGWLTIAAPLAMLYLFIYVTGIPPAEKQSLASRGEAYREYQRTTNAFFPWFRTK
jgi:steroid 5-alpha reductase family enzyme